MRLFEAADPSLVEVHLCAERFHPQREIPGLDTRSGDVGYQATQYLVVQAVPLRLPTPGLGIADGGCLVDARLGVERLNQGIRIEEQLQEGIQQTPSKSKEGVRRVVEGRGLERVFGLGLGRLRFSRYSGRATQFVDERRLDDAGVEDGLESARGKFLDLLIAQVDSMTLRDTSPYLAHDLLDVEVVTPGVLCLLLRLRSPVSGAAVRPAPAAVIVGPAGVLWVVISWHRPSALRRRRAGEPR